MGQGAFSAEGVTSGIHRPIDLLFHRGVKLVCLIFGQQWNPAYRKVEDKFVKFYNNLRAQGENRLEMVYISLDQDKRRMYDAYRHHPWLARSPHAPR